MSPSYSKPSLSNGTRAETALAAKSVIYAAHVVIALVRLVAGSVFVLLLSHPAPGQQVPPDVEETAAHAGVAADAADVFKQKLMRQIELEVTAVRQAESAHAANLELSLSYMRLGLSYSDAAQWGEV